jgi:hypothetical protein
MHILSDIGQSMNQRETLSERDSESEEEDENVKL